MGYKHQASPINKFVQSHLASSTPPSSHHYPALLFKDSSCEIFIFSPGLTDIEPSGALLYCCTILMGFLLNNKVITK